MEFFFYTTGCQTDFLRQTHFSKCQQMVLDLKHIRFLQRKLEATFKHSIQLFIRVTEWWGAQEVRWTHEFSFQMSCSRVWWSATFKEAWLFFFSSSYFRVNWKVGTTWSDLEQAVKLDGWMLASYRKIMKGVRVDKNPRLPEPNAAYLSCSADCAWICTFHPLQAV